MVLSRALSTILRGPASQGLSRQGIKPRSVTATGHILVNRHKSYLASSEALKCKGPQASGFRVESRRDGNAESSRESRSLPRG